MPKPKNTTPKILWKPDTAMVEESLLAGYSQWLTQDHHIKDKDFHGLWDWSVRQPADFWESIWKYFDVKTHKPYKEVLSGDTMLSARWFQGSSLNYAEHIFRQASPDRPAILFKSERQPLTRVSWEELETKVASLQAFLLDLGLKPGDRVAAFMPNIPETTIGFLSTISLGCVWSSCSPDFGSESVIDRFRQIEPRVLIAVDGYQYGGKAYDKTSELRALMDALPSVERLILLPYPGKASQTKDLAKTTFWQEALSTKGDKPQFTPVPFDHPIWILYSSGTTGAPKAITHGHGGVLLEHLKYLSFHNNVKPGERYFWYSTTGWMMWNFVQGALLTGATIVLYDGSPAWPYAGVLWQLAEDAKINHFGTSAPFILHSMKEKLEPGRSFDLSRLLSISSTGSPLPPEAFSWIYREVKPDIWLVSMSGGTDVCTAFVGGCPWEPVYEGEIQCRALGCSLYAYNALGEPVIDELGEMVITRPMPSMPVYFWGDKDKKRYRESYYDTFPNVWRHGDWVKITSRDTVIIYGRSDATLNRHGVRIGTAEVYRALHHVTKVKDSLIVNLELPDGGHFMPLFIVLQKDGEELDDSLKTEIKNTLRAKCSPRHVPDAIVAVPDIPYTLSGKKLEAPVKKILMGMPLEEVVNPDALRNPEALDYFKMYSKQNWK